MKINEITNIFERGIDLSSITNAEDQKELDYAFQDLSDKFPEDEEMIEDAYDKKLIELENLKNDIGTDVDEHTADMFDNLSDEETNILLSNIEEYRPIYQIFKDNGYKRIRSEITVKKRNVYRETWGKDDERVVVKSLGGKMDTTFAFYKMSESPGSRYKGNITSIKTLDKMLKHIAERG